LSPLRTGFVYGAVAVVIAVVVEFYFLFLDPTGTPAWVLANVASFRTPLALAAFFFLAILAALRARPTRTDPDVSYKSLLVRDCALAATVVGVVVGVTLFLSTALQATLFAGEIQTFARDAAPQIADYVEEVRSARTNPPPPTTPEEVESVLQPPELQDLGRSMGNVVLGTILLGATGALIGALRGSFGSERDNPENGKSPQG
jgi:hypothetical protein